MDGWFGMDEMFILGQQDMYREFIMWTIKYASFY